jgi:arabinofuranosyltransferase
MKRVLSLTSGLLLGLAGPAVFLIVEQSMGWSGFPLDDAWIHQTYARSLATGAGWIYSGGAPSGGSTSPLWTLMQIPAFWFGISPVVWSTMLGILFLLCTATFIMLWIRRADSTAARWTFLLCVAEWHLVWAALSGMETILFCSWIALMVFFFFPIVPRRSGITTAIWKHVLLGLLAGAGIWIRPEALLLSGLILPTDFLCRKRVPARRTVSFLLGFLLPIIVYFLFEYQLTGRLLPNTFFVKTVEYAPLTTSSIFQRILTPWPTLLAGSGILLILFFPAAIGSLARHRRLVAGLPALWAAGHLVLYAVQLPATYQHGRYFLPILPVLIGYGAYGFFLITRRFRTIHLVRMLVRALGAASVGLTVVFLWVGAQQFTRDVEIIEEIVNLSHWISDHTACDSIVAAHDIGALGFWGNRRLVDLGGVTDLEALPLLRGTVSLREFLSQKEVDLLMTMPMFYPQDVDSCIPVPEAPVGSSSRDPRYRTLLFDLRTGCTW